MSRYIDADVARRIIDSPRSKEQMLLVLSQAEPADVVKVVHGKWVPTRKDSDISFCSNCESYWIIRDDAYDYLYCPKCGAKMEVSE